MYRMYQQSVRYQLPHGIYSHVSCSISIKDTSVNSHELKDTKKQLKRNIKHAEATLKDVQMAVNLIEGDRDKFHHISDQELYERRSFVQTSRDRINRAKQDMQSEAVKAKLLADERAKANRRAGTDRYGAKNAAQQEGTDAIIDSQARTSLLMEHQDETLDVLGEAVGRVSQMAEVIHEEIDQQNKMLTEMEEDLTNVEEELGLVMGKLAKFLKTKDTWQLKTIIILTGIMLLLLMLVIYS
jgi:syntaxin 6